MTEVNESGNLSGKSMPSSNGKMQNGNALPPNVQESRLNAQESRLNAQGPRLNGQEPRLNGQGLNPSPLSPNVPPPNGQEPIPDVPMPNGQELSQDHLTQRDLKHEENAWRNGSPPLNAPQPHVPLVNRPEVKPNELPLSGQAPNLPGTEMNDSEARRRKDALDLWRSLKNVNANLPEDLIADELTAASDATDLQTKSFGECWLRSRCPMPRLRISDGVSERLIPWYSILEVHVDATFRLFELYLAGDVVCRIISRRPQQELYANLQLERVKVIYPVANVAVSFEDLKAKKPGPDSSGAGNWKR